MGAVRSVRLANGAGRAAPALASAGWPATRSATLDAMSRRAFAWFLSVPLIGAGVEGGHWLVYRLVYPDPYVRAQVLAQTGHHYLDYAPFAFAVVGAVVVCAFGSRIFARARGPESGSGQVSLLPFLVAAPVAFALQECIERLLVGSWPFSAAFEPTFMPGVALQFPIGLVLFLLARWLLRAVDRLRLLVLGPGARRILSLAAGAVRAQAEVVDLFRLGALAAGFGERGPPPVLVPALPARL